MPATLPEAGRVNIMSAEERQPPLAYSQPSEYSGVTVVPYPLLTTKLYLPPARPNIVRRPRLTARLAEGLQRPLTLVSAPAGFGKTTLLSEWRATAWRDHLMASVFGIKRLA